MKFTVKINIRMRIPLVVASSLASHAKRCGCERKQSSPEFLGQMAVCRGGGGLKLVKREHVIAVVYETFPGVVRHV